MCDKILSNYLIYLDTQELRYTQMHAFDINWIFNNYGLHKYYKLNIYVTQLCKLNQYKMNSFFARD